MNKAIIIGRLGQDPKVSTTKSGKSVCSFSVATDRKKGEEKVTTWHRIIAWGNLADACGKFLKKGNQAAIEGEITHREYDGKNITEIVASSVEFIGSKN